MSRVKKAVHALKNRRNTLRKAKGYRFGRSKKERQANEALVHAGAYAFAHRRDKKNDFRKLWNARISAVLRTKNIPYGKFIGMLKKKNIVVDRKIMALLAEKHPESFNRLIAEAVG